MSFVVAIDGPSGTGKGTITKKIAEELNLINIDTGAMYRCIALNCLNQGINQIEEKEKIIEIAKNTNVKIEHHGAEQEIFLNGENVSYQIRTEEVTKFVSPVSAISEVREIMTDMQRKMAEGKQVIMEGRDIGTTVFPNANVKIYLDAAAEERANRRYKEYQEKGINLELSYEEVLKAIEERDYRDSHREISPLSIAQGANVIDTTNMTIEEVANKVKQIILETKENN
ncbi:MAG: (d)CMP kinase [Clostridia bacterium]|nr:(d)CMP kinase [Clostridia bacterium]